MRTLSGRVGDLMRSGAGIAVAMGIMNVATYGYTIIAARLLGPQQYGAFAAMMNLLLVASVISLGLQTTAARRISADPGHVDQIQTQVLRVTTRVALLLGAGLFLLSPAINVLLNLDNLAMAALLGPAMVPLTMMGGLAGTLQGERRWLALGVLYVAAGVPRLLVGVAMLAWQPTELSAMLAVTLTSVAPVLVGWWALRHDRVPGLSSETHGGRLVAKEALQNSQALLAFFILSNVDLIVASNVLSGHDAGLYAGGLILTKAMLFLPQFVVIVAFPSMAATQGRRQALARGLGLVAGMGVLGTLAAWLLSPLALKFVGGAEFAEIEGRLWVFAVLGTSLAMLQLLVYSVIARQGQRSVYLVWAAVVALVLGAVVSSSLDGLLLWVALVDVALLLALVAISFFLLDDEQAVAAADQESPAPELG